jgi:hypothetical protein
LEKLIKKSSLIIKKNVFDVDSNNEPFIQLQPLIISLINVFREMVAAVPVVFPALRRRIFHLSLSLSSSNFLN